MSVVQYTVEQWSTIKQFIGVGYELQSEESSDFIPVLELNAGHAAPVQKAKIKVFSDGSYDTIECEYDDNYIYVLSEHGRPT